MFRSRQWRYRRWRSFRQRVVVLEPPIPPIPPAPVEVLSTRVFSRMELRGSSKSGPLVAGVLMNSSGGSVTVRGVLQTSATIRE